MIKSFSRFRKQIQRVLQRIRCQEIGLLHLRRFYAHRWDGCEGDLPRVMCFKDHKNFVRGQMKEKLCFICWRISVSEVEGPTVNYAKAILTMRVTRETHAARILLKFVETTYVVHFLRAKLHFVKFKLSFLQFLWPNFLWNVPIWQVYTIHVS